MESATGSDQPRAQTGTHAGTSPQSATALSRELGDFLIELSIALHKHAMYPPGHPLLGPAAERVNERLSTLLVNKTSLALGVARSQLVIEGVATDPKNPVLRDLAERLHDHQLGAVAFNRGVTPFEIEGFLKLVAADPESIGGPLGTGPAERRQSQPHINLYPVAYDRLQLVGDEEVEVGTGDREERAARTRSAQLWIGLARAALALEEVATDQEVTTQADPSAVARAISEQQRGRAYDQVIVGYLLQIADELKGAGGSDALALRSRMAKLISHLEPATLRSLLDMGGDSLQRKRFLLDASQGMAVDAVIKLAHAASQTQQQTVSHSLLRILEKLAHHSESGTPARRKLAEASVREQVSELIEGWSLVDPNPDEYTQALRKIAHAEPRRRTEDANMHHAEPQRVVQMALEVNETGPTVSAAIDEMVAAHQTRWMVDLLNKAGTSSASTTMWNELASPERLSDLLSEHPIDVDALDGILPRMGSRAAEPMMDALIDSESTQVRRVLLDRLKNLGPGVAPLAVARLADSRWYVQRNMLSIIGELPELPEGFQPDDFFRHPDERVRREALRIMIENPASRERAICRAVADADERTVRMGLAAALKDCPKSAVSLVISRATGGASEDQRLAAIRVLGSIGDPAALDVLLGLVSRRKSLLGWKTPTKTPEYVAALRALLPHRSYPGVAAALNQAAAAKDPEIAGAVRESRDTDS